MKWFREKAVPGLAELDQQIRALSAKADTLEAKERIRYIQVEPKNEGDPKAEYAGGDPAYQEWVADLLNDTRFQWLIYKRQMQMIDIMNLIPRGDAGSAEMRQRAAYRMDGIQMLIDDMVAIKRAHMLAQLPPDKEGLA